jgi:hypothetical protein
VWCAGGQRSPYIIATCGHWLPAEALGILKRERQDESDSELGLGIRLP